MGSAVARVSDLSRASSSHRIRRWTVEVDTCYAKLCLRGWVSSRPLSHSLLAGLVNSHWPTGFSNHYRSNRLLPSTSRLRNRWHPGPRLLSAPRRCEPGSTRILTQRILAASINLGSSTSDRQLAKTSEVVGPHAHTHALNRQRTGQRPAEFRNCGNGACTYFFLVLPSSSL